MAARWAYPEPRGPLQKYRLLGRSGLRVSPLSLGAMTFGTQWNAFLGECSKEEARAIFEAYVSRGGNFIDTATNYQNGQSEEWLGEFIEESKTIKRDDLVIATKFTGAVPGSSVNAAGNARKNAVAVVEKSLKRLRTTYIDVLYVHLYDGTVDAEELMHSLDCIVRTNKVLHLGVSDTPAWFVAQCNTIAKARGWAQFVCYQGRYNACDRDVEGDVLPMCTAFEMAFVPWSVLAAGKLASKTREGTARGAGELSELEKRVHTAVCEVADKLGKTPAAVAISWVAARIPSVLVGARKVGQLVDAIDGVSFRLSDEDDSKISAAGKPVLPFPHNMIGTTWPTRTQVGFTRPAGEIVPTFNAPIAEAKK